MMKSVCLLAALVCITAATPAPRISLDLSAVRVFKLSAPIVKPHDLGFKQPTGQSVMSRQDYSARCAAGASTYKTCPFPYARAYDHQDQSVAVHTRVFLVNTQPVNGAPKSLYKRVAKVDFSQRSTYLFRYDATDLSGNKAEQIVFALILDDTESPKIQLCGGAFEKWEAASSSRLCSYSSAYDNIDKDITKRITYTIQQITPRRKTLGSRVALAKAKNLITTRHRNAKFIVRLSVSDNARLYGKNHRSNSAEQMKAILVQDTK